MIRRFLRPLPTLVLIVAILMGCQNNEPGKSPDETTRKGNSPSAMGVISVAEVRASELEKAIKDQKGNVVLIDCWATWCRPCVASFPNLVERHKKFAEKGLTCMSLSMDKLGPPGDYKKEKVLTFLESKGATFQNFIVGDPRQDSDQLTKLIGDFEFIPYMVMFDRNGRRVWTSDDRPQLSESQLDRKIETLLADMP